MPAKIRLKFNIGDMVGKCIYLGELLPTQTHRQKVRTCLFECPYCKSSFKSFFGRVRHEEVVSCGCYALAVFGAKYRTHAKSKSSEFRIWTGIKQRCYNKKHTSYPNYGAMGIKMCDSWINSFENFLKDMGERPSMEYTIDRYPDMNGNYEPNNCRWATHIQQSNNKNTNVVITYLSKSMTIAEWAREIGVKDMTLRRRLKKGWDLSNCFTTAKFRGRRCKNNKRF